MSPHLLPALRALPEPTAVSLPFFPNLRSEIRLGAWGFIGWPSRCLLGPFRVAVFLAGAFLPFCHGGYVWMLL